MKDINASAWASLLHYFQSAGPSPEERILRACGASIAKQVRLRVDILGALRSHPLADDLEDFAHLCVRSRLAHARGFVYLCSGHSHFGLVKVGQTKLQPLERIKALNNESVLLPLELLWSLPVHDRFYVEATVHRRLRKEGVSRVKEFFAESQSRLAECIEQVAFTDQKLFEQAGFGEAFR